MLESPLAPAFLDVTASATGRRWIGPRPDVDRLGLAIAQSAGVPEIVGRVLASRGIRPEEAAAHLAPTLRDLMPDPSSLRDMDRAAARFCQAVQRRERIAVFADYDVDGGASAALILTWLRRLGRDATLYIPDRIDEGYGPNVPAMRTLGATHDLVICVDCGTLSHEPVAATGCDVIILDHHLAGETLPEAVAIVNPNRQDESGDLGHLCAAGVVFLMLVAANRLMKQAGETGPNLLDMLDLVALATVADVAPLIGLNRALVRQGLKVMAGGRRPGLAALAGIAKVTGVPTAFSLGFALGPRVNAGGRIGAADLGARLLATDDPNEAAALADRLDRLNTERRDIEAAVLIQAEAQVMARGADGPLVWAAGEGWHPGVVGIVAARLKETFNRPALVIGLAGGEGKGSGRSVPGIDLGAAIARLAREGMIARGGGHRMAAGISLTTDQIVPAMDRLAVLLAGAGAGGDPPRALHVDGVAAPGAVTVALADSIAAAGPYGAAAPSPRLAVTGRLVAVRPIGTSHHALSLADPMGGNRLDAIAFRTAGTPLGEFFAARAGTPVHLAGRVEQDVYGGRIRVKLHVEDAAPA